MKRLPALIGLVSLVFPMLVFAQTKAPPTMILSWQADSYVGADYAGKVLPIRDSAVDVYLEFIDKGVVVPLNKNIVRWEVSGSFLVAGEGLKHIQFPLNRFTSRSYEVTATIKGYNDQDIKKTVIIKRVDPVVTLQAGPSEKVSGGTQASFSAYPFFFSSSNPNDYMFNWTVNGISASSRMQTLKVLLQGAASEKIASVAVTASNLTNEIESADAEKKFIIND